MSDVENRRTILQNLQQTRSRLQRQQSEERTSKSSSSVTTPNNNLSQATPLLPLPQRPPPAPNPQHEPLFITKQQKIALQQATTQSQGYYISQPSQYGNLVIPVLPRFNDRGQLLPMN